MHIVQQGRRGNILCLNESYDSVVKVMGFNFSYC